MNKQIVIKSTNPIEREHGYNLSMTLDEIRPNYRFDVSCQGSVPQEITAFLESTDFKDAIRNAISISGDSDTIATITGKYCRSRLWHSRLDQGENILLS